jgi:hypothetical protein
MGVRRFIKVRALSKSRTFFGATDKVFFLASVGNFAQPSNL